jgi:DNA-binding NarL/FixJ family response regulator
MIPTSKLKARMRVFVAEDHPRMLDKIVQLLAPHCEVIGTATDGETALELIKYLKPDIAVLDISLPNKTGIEIAAELKTNRSDVKVVFITVHLDENYLKEAINVGASSFVIKIRLADDLIKALESVYDGKVFISPNDKVTSSLRESLS